MHAIHSLVRSRRGIALLSCIVAAVLLTTAIVLEPPSSTSDVSSGGTVEEGNAGEPALKSALDDAVAPERDAAGASTEAAPGIAADSIAEVPSPTAGSPITTLAPPELDARIVRNGRLELRAKRAGFEDAWSDVQSVASANGGYVVAASRSGAGDGARAGTISMRVPTRRFDAAVDRLRDTTGTKVQQLDVTSQDVTQEFVDVRSRLRHDRAVEARLLLLLGQTEGVSEVLAVQGRLDQVQEQIELSKGRLDYLDKMTSMSTIDVGLRAPAASGADEADDDEPSVLRESLADARDRFEGNVAGAIVWVGGALPILVLFGVLALVARVAWRRHNSRAEQVVSR